LFAVEIARNEYDLLSASISVSACLHALALHMQLEAIRLS